MKVKNIVLLAVLFLGIFITTPVFAKIGVGVGLGKIQIDEPLLPGGIYKFPTIPVLNTGDETLQYEMDVTYHENQPEFRPEKDWFLFSPQNFEMNGGDSQPVEVRINLPLKLAPGDYFAYLEAHPVATGEGGVTIGVAAATKVYFTVEAANVWQAAWYKTISFFTTTSPTSYIVLGVLAAIILLLIFKKYFSFNVSISKKDAQSEDTEPKNENKKEPSDHEKNE